MARGKKNRTSGKGAGTALANVNEAAPHHADPESGLPFPIVCIGASAGGVEATLTLMSVLAPDTGMAFVVVLHLDPNHPTFLPEIIGRVTTMPVVIAESYMPVEPNRVHVIAPGKNMVIGDGMLQLAPRTEIRGQHRPIDHFLRSLAEEHGHKALAIILSGMGNDGALGIEEIKSAAGITFAQDKTAEYSSMPRNAIATGCVDFVLAPAAIGQELNRISRHPLVAQPQSPQDHGPEAAYSRVVEVLRETSGVDFSNYKRNTLYRRMTRRMVLHKLENLASYAEFLASNSAEAEALYQDVLINVTSFFRDPEAYELLKTRVFPALANDRSRHEPLRVWALGCSTGEEAYSIAMAYTEYAEATSKRVPMQIFATDLNGAGIEKARAGIYSKASSRTSRPNGCAASSSKWTAATASASRSATCASSRARTSWPIRRSRASTSSPAGTCSSTSNRCCSSGSSRCCTTRCARPASSGSACPRRSVRTATCSNCRTRNSSSTRRRKTRGTTTGAPRSPSPPRPRSRRRARA
jgi:two-component system CheB/CheR fusion protein